MRDEVPRHRGRREPHGHEYEAHLRRTRAMLDRPCFDTLFVDYADAIAAPREVAERVNVFVGGLDVERMAAAVNAGLYRQRQRS